MFPTPLLALLSALLLTSPTNALPSRTHCLCTITPPNAAPSPSLYTDSLANPDTLIATPTPPDLCAALGPSLETLRAENPTLYASYITRTADRQHLSAATTAQTPLATTLLLRLAAAQGFQNLGVVIPAAGSETSVGAERISCRAEPAGAEPEGWAAYQVSWVTLVVLQVVVVLVVVACVAEGIMFSLRWLRTKTPVSVSLPSLSLPLPISKRSTSPLRLSGAEKRLLALPQLDTVDLRSPGLEKKMRVYASPAWKAARYAYIEDEDDEFNRPVM